MIVSNFMSKNFRRVLMTSVGAAVLATTMDYSASAQQVAQLAAPSQNILEEIVVTGIRKREEDAQSTPLAITAMNAEMLARSQITNFDQIGNLAPNLQIDKNLGTGGVTNVYLRGFGDYSNDPAVDPHVAIFVDGVYQPAPSGTLFDMFDLEQVEVAAGPQGTLSGRNAPIGAVYITSAKPNGTFGGEVEADYGSYNHIGVRAKVNVPILKDADGHSVLAVKASLVEKEGGNWVYNVFNGKRDFGGENTHSGRLAIAFTPGDRLEWYVSVTETLDRSPQNGSFPTNFEGGVAGSPSNALQTFPYPCLFAQLGLLAKGCEHLDYGQTDSNFTSRTRSDQTNLSSTINYRFDPVTVSLVGGFVDYWLIDNIDDGGNPFAALNAYADHTRFDEETVDLRVSSNKGGGWDANGLLDWVVGGYFSNERYFFSNNLGIGVLGGFALPIGYANTIQFENGTTQSKALYAHTIFNFTDEFAGTFGIRRTWDWKAHNFEGAGATKYAYDTPSSWTNNSLEAGLQYKFEPGKMAYFRFAQGYESGGFAGFATGNSFAPELNNEYEFGVKTDWLHHHLRVNADVFQNNITNLQVESALAIPTPPGFLQETLNAGSAVTQGAEVQITALPIHNVTTHLTAGYLESHFNKNLSTTCSNTLAAVDCSALPLAMAPRWTLSLGGDYIHDLPNEWGTADLALDWNYKTRLYTADPVYPSSLQNGYGIVNASVTFRDPTEKYTLKFYGTNILNRHYISGYTDPSGLAAWEKQGDPAEWGISVSAKF